MHDTGVGAVIATFKGREAGVHIFRDEIKVVMDRDLNLVAISANGGVMPASPSALRASGWTPAPGHFANSAAVADPRLPWLGDVFATPSWLPVHSVFSLGDIVIVAGVAVFLQQTCRRSDTPARATEGGDVLGADPAAATHEAGAGADPATGR